MMEKKPLFVPKRTAVNPDYGYGVCLWQMPNGSYIQDSEQNYLCAQAKMYDPGTELKMRKAVRSMGITEGKPLWLSGFRAVSNMEWEDQMADLLDGGVPDAVDLYRQKKHGN